MLLAFDLDHQREAEIGPRRDAAGGAIAIEDDALLLVRTRVTLQALALDDLRADYVGSSSASDGVRLHAHLRRRCSSPPLEGVCERADLLKA